MNGNNGSASYDVIYFDSFGLQHIPKHMKKFIENKNIVTNIYRMQAFDSIICGYLFVEFIYIMLKAKNMLDYTNSFSSKM